MLYLYTFIADTLQPILRKERRGEGRKEGRKEGGKEEKKREEEKKEAGGRRYVYQTHRIESDSTPSALLYQAVIHPT